MLERIGFENVGPFRKAELKLAPRVNLLVGEHWVGKTLLLNTAWWGMTGRWPKDEGCICFVGNGSRIRISCGGGIELKGKWHLNSFWERSGGEPPSDSVFYARLDGEYFGFPRRDSTPRNAFRPGALLVGVKGHDPRVMLVDELELHLHPKRQRTVLPGLLREVSARGRSDFQLIASTNSPLVLASMEPLFDEKKDALHVLVEDEQGNVTIDRAVWRPRGDASAWLTSEVFGLKQARSMPTEAAIEKALQAMRSSEVPIEELQEIHNELYGVLGELDPFWVRWTYEAERRGVEV